MKPEEHAPAEAVGAAHQRGIGEAEADQALGLGEALRARRARGRDRHAEAVELERMLEEFAEGVRGVDDGPAQVRGELAVRLQAAIGFLRRADARCRCPGHDRDAMAAITLPRRRQALAEAVLPEREPREAVVAAVPNRERWGQ